MCTFRLNCKVVPGSPEFELSNGSIDWIRIAIRNCNGIGIPSFAKHFTFALSMKLI